MDTLTKNIILTPLNLLYKVSPKLTLKILFRLKMGKKLNLNNPVTYNEKLQWIKLYDKNELMPICADKYTVRDYVKSRGCGEILNDLLWEGYNPNDIPFEDLPEQFVIKVTHGSTFNIICEDKSKLNKKDTISNLNKWLKAKFIPSYGEWFYGIVKPRIIIEKYLKDRKSNSLYDYKFFCFHGEPKLVYVDTWKDNKHSINAYDTNFNIIPNVQLGYENDLTTSIPKPDKFEEMLQYARRLSKDFLHVRVDFYEVNGEVIFGELTFTKSAGFGKIKPYSFDEKMGSWIRLPVRKV
ncbi:ATP-grasp fold amidoligase family protein [Oceanobacillus alkalisoli]|uniref:ATP-grasp fold amidoligase family protein n=1 Tax=Oceanobacillus alkalisoli TaxID=2925113 RepID=UPI001EE3C298|nr:ATP-grasp fold amidoligase family protein [Oceanobacillus alkalisoli]MCG5102605.1 glycosyl transferase [Oceanobacillus alkalisoli]